MFVVTTVVLVWRFAGSKNGGAQKDARRGHFCDGSQAGVGISEYLGIIYRINFILYNRIYNIVQFGTWELDFRILGNYLPNPFLLVKQHVIFGTSESIFPNTWELSTELISLPNTNHKRKTILGGFAKHRSSWTTPYPTWSV